MSEVFVSAATLRRRLAEAGDRLVLADVRCYLDGRDPATEFARGHLSRAVLVDLDADLAGPRGSRTGRHPLPSPEEFAESMSRLGISCDATVVAYDDQGGVMAARLVWMLRAVGVDAALLDGGPDCAGTALETGPARAPEPARFEPRPWPTELMADLDDVRPAGSGPVDAGADALVLLDARPRERYAGTAPEVDARAGHIPGARNLPCRENLGPDGRLLPADVLRTRLAAVGVGAEAIAAGRVVSSCGSGVTACHTLLVAEHLGLGRARLYPGSWSQYAATELPISTGSMGS